MYLIKPHFLVPRKRVVHQAFLFYEKLAKMPRPPHAVQAEEMLTFSVAGRWRATASSLKLTENKASGGGNYKLYGLLHFINLTSGS